MATKAFVTVADYGGVDGKEEISSTSFYVQDITALNYGSVTQDIDEVKDAIITVIRGEVREVGFTKTFPESASLVTDAEAHRESKWLVVYKDTTVEIATGVPNAGFGKLFNFEVPTALLTGVTAVNSDLMDLSTEPGLSFKADIEANVRSPYNWAATTPTIQVQRVVHVGRNT